jgi:Amt family ammonium transporter
MGNISSWYFWKFSWIASSFLILFTLKKTVGIRVSEKEELEGLDLHEHGMSAYSDFRMNEH